LVDWHLGREGVVADFNEFNAKMIAKRIPAAAVQFIKGNGAAPNGLRHTFFL
jgi:hypothetical protein